MELYYFMEGIHYTCKQQLFSLFLKLLLCIYFQRMFYEREVNNNGVIGAYELRLIMAAQGTYEFYGKLY